MSTAAENATATRILQIARDNRVTYCRTERDALADHITRLAGDDVALDEIEQLLVALQRSGHLTRIEMVKLQARYLREAKS
jgi:hypothetical protein